MKTINHGDRTKDPGKDGITNSFAPDVFGTNIEYYSSDYTRSGSNITSIQPVGYPQHYNGNITAISWHSRKPAGTGGTLENPVMNAYRYDGKDRFQSNSWGTPNFTSNTFSEQANVNKEHTLAYDLNGNITTLKRTDAGGSLVGNYTYNYTANTNKLASVSNYASYQYDAIGQMTTEQKTGGRNFYLQYDVTGQVVKIFTNSAQTQLYL